jgi:hypothetical protein
MAAGRGLGRAMPLLGAASTIPDTLQLGDKASDALGVNNNIGRGAIKTTAVAGGLGSAIGGAKAGARFGRFFGAKGRAVGGLIGGIGGAIVPGFVNETLNYKNNRQMEMGANMGRAAGMQTEFSNALQAKNSGNPNAMQAWYNMAGDGSDFRNLVGQYKGQNDLQGQMILNHPNRPQ